MSTTQKVKAPRGHPPSKVFADRLHEERHRPLEEGQRPITLAEVARRVNALAGPGWKEWDERVVMKIEQGTRAVKLDEFVLIARALDVAPCLMLAPLEDRAARVRIGDTALRADDAREWVRGECYPFPTVSVKQWNSFFWEKVPRSWLRRREDEWEKSRLQGAVPAGHAGASRALYAVVTGETKDLRHWWPPERPLPTEKEN